MVYTAICMPVESKKCSEETICAEVRFPPPPHKYVKKTIVEMLCLFIWSWYFCSVIFINAWTLFWTPPLWHWLPNKVTWSLSSIQFSNYTHNGFHSHFFFIRMMFWCFIKKTQKLCTHKHIPTSSGISSHKIPLSWGDTALGSHPNE